jgi:hypothetical protein
LPGAREVLAGRLRWQAAACRSLGSPFYSALLEDAAADLEHQGPVWEVLRDFGDEPEGTAIALRLMGSVHRLVLRGSLPELAQRYPSTGGDGDAAAAWPIFRKALIDEADHIRALTRGGCQTNEVGRSAALLGGFLEVAHRTGLPLRILELGASAGLNLRWDRYRYESADGAWGEPSSPVRFDHAFVTAPPLNRAAEVAERIGCDLHPIDPASEDGSLTLRAFVWADQLARMGLLDGALQVASSFPAPVERSDAASFLRRELARRNEHLSTVVYHSVFIQYVGAEEREEIRAEIDRAGVFYLTMEPARAVFEVRLNGDLLGTSLAHGTGVRWNVDSTPL